jgi:hypothetical protein
MKRRRPPLHTTRQTNGTRDGGAARGIGQTIAVGLAERGASVVLGDIDAVSETAELMDRTGGPVSPTA